MTIKLEWSEPPNHLTGQQAERARVVEQLKGKPGVWALVETDVAASTRKAWQRFGCEATARRRETDNDINGRATYTHDVYARWPETDLAAVDPYIARRRKNGIPRGGKRP